MRTRHVVAVIAGVVVGAACDSGSENGPASATRCAAFAPPPDPVPSFEPSGGAEVADVSRVVAAAGRTYALAAGAVRVVDRGSEAVALEAVVGALDLAVAPDGARAFVLAARGTAPDTTYELVRFTSADGGKSFDASSVLTVLTVPRTGAAPATGAIAFGPDKMLYVALADADVSVAADLGSLLGKVLRLDVSGAGVAAPPDNPFAAIAHAKPEIWALGFRAPTGIDFDPESGDGWIVDRGSKADEIDRLAAGKHFGWPVRESGLCAGQAATCEKRDFAEPVMVGDGGNLPRLERPGFFYRGSLVPGLVGKYLVAAGGALYAIDRFGPAGPATATRYGVAVPGTIGRGADGEAAAVGPRGLVRMIDTAPPSAVPRSLVATGCWDTSVADGVVAGAIRYEVASPLWSDGAAKGRFAVVPAGAKITVNAASDFVFPTGTVMVKTFSVAGKRVETRLLVQHSQEDWRGYSYAWNDAQTDATLLSGSKVTTLPSGQQWYFPSSTDCTACHTPQAGYTLGPELRQVGTAYDAFAPLLAPSVARDKVPQLVAADDAKATVEMRARSYLHANCSSCHRQGTATGSASLDLTVDRPLEQTGLCREPQGGGIGGADRRIVVPGIPGASVLLQRMRATDDTRMPKLASHVVDPAGLAAVEAWIEGLPSCP